MPVHAHLDFETRSLVDVSKVGAARYAEHPSTEIMCLVYRIGKGEYGLWRPFDDNPEELFTHIRNGGLCKAHNAFFEQMVWLHKCVRDMGWPEIPIRQWACSAAKVAAHSLPRALGKAGAALRLDVTKDEAGKRVMMKLTKARKPTKTDKSLWHHKEEDFETLYDYCRSDVASECAIDEYLRDMPPAEQELWYVDQIINARGVMVDIEAVDAALEILKDYGEQLDFELALLTGGKVNTVNERDKLIAWVQGQGVLLPDATADTIALWLERPDLPQVVRDVLTIRSIGAKASTKKYAAIKRSICADGRLRDLLMFHGANTGRWSGKIVQMQNLAKGKIEDMDAAVAAIKMGDIDTIRAMSENGNVMEVMGGCVRGMFISSPGTDLMVADYASIEARALAWLADHEVLLKVFEQPSAPVYEAMATEIYGRPITKEDKAERQVGKQAVLGCFGADTKVLTSNGIKHIVDVQTTDQLWDGVEWVNHGGVVDQGEKETIYLEGVQVTPDHQILVEKTWVPAISLVRNPNIKFRALATGSVNLLSQVSNWGDEAELKKLWLNVPVGVGSTPYFSTTCIKVNLHAVIVALKSNQVITEKNIQDMQTSSQMMHIENVCLTEYHPALVGVIVKQIGDTPIMEKGGYTSTENGAKIAKTSSDTYSPWKVGTHHILNWIGSTLIKATNRATFVLCPKVKMQKTKDASPIWKPEYEPSKKKILTYDILNSGNKNRFTIVTDAGPLVVHNCGYGMGAPKFQATCEKYGINLTGAATIPILISALQVRLEKLYREKEKLIEDGKEKAQKRLQPKIDILSEAIETVSTCTETPLAVAYCELYDFDPALLVAEYVVRVYRESNDPIVQYWWDTEKMAVKAVQNPGVVFTSGKCQWLFTNRFLYCRLPSGRRLAYCDPWIEPVMTPWGQEKPSLRFMGESSMSRKWEEQHTYGGKLVENITQAVARDVLAHAIVKLEHETDYKVVFHVHDEIVAEIPEGQGDVKEFEQLITTLPAWAEGFPIAAEAWRGKRYKK